jgi:arabinan endo-1,5-alpha-L-arabinosidase
MTRFGNLLQDSTIARFLTAMFTSLIITSATLLPIIAHFEHFGHAAPVAQAAPVPQAYSPPPTISEGYPDPQPCHGNCSWVHDPSIIYEDGTYWRFTTSGNIAIATAPNLEGPWTYQGPLLHNGTSIRIRDDQDIWVSLSTSHPHCRVHSLTTYSQAPSITKRDDTYYCHYSVSYIYSQHSEIGVATSPSLSPGTWTDHGAIGLPQNACYNLIDPNVFQENDSSPNYFTFGSYWTGIQQLEMPSHDAALLSWAGTESSIKNIISNTTANYAVQEGAVMYKNEDSYYVFFSVGQCCRTQRDLVPPGDEYHVVVCRAHGITGPYHDAEGKDCLTENGGTIVLASHGDVYAPGGQGILWDPKTERDVIYYHYGELCQRFVIEWGREG